VVIRNVVICRIHGVISRTTELFIVTVGRLSNPGTTLREDGGKGTDSWEGGSGRRLEAVHGQSP
jgi:hypothetical protein